MITTAFLAVVSALLLFNGDGQITLILGILTLILAGVQAGCIIIGST